MQKCHLACNILDEGTLNNLQSAELVALFSNRLSISVNIPAPSFLICCKAL